MARTLVSGFLAVVALALALPAGAQARTPCPSERVVPTAANSAAVSDAILCLTNQIRVSYGLAPFRRDARLDTAARLHSEDMAARNYFAHVTPEGLSPGDRAARQGYTLGVGENIAAGYRDARAVVLGWMESAGHCRNILGTARDIGVGTAPTPRPNYTQAFGDYDFGAGTAIAGGCPVSVNFDTLVVPDDPLAPITAGPATATATASPATATPAAAVPALGRLGLSRTRLRAGGGGTRVTYTLATASTVTFRVQRAAGDGRWRTLRGSIADAGESGTNSFRFRARLRGQALRRGSYRLVAVAADAAGNASPERRVRFRVVAR
jgi:uncharacterized protein YkwD